MTIRSVHRGFTLIEVLLATFIIALGVLGLLALFAGAAKQQQVSSQETGAVFAARAAEKSLKDSLSNMVLRPSGCSNDPFPPNVWRRMQSDEDDGFLRIADGSNPCSPYTLIPGTSAVLYQAPARAALELPGPNHEWGFLGTPTGAFAGWTFELPHRRIEADTLLVEIEISWLGVDVDGVPFETRQTLRYSRNPIAAYASDSAGMYILTLDGNTQDDPAEGFVDASTGTNPDDDYLRLDAQENPNGTARARIVDLHVGEVEGSTHFDTAARIESVRVVEYKWRDDTIVSLNDRVRTRADASAPEGRRPDQSYSVLYRRTATGSQAMVISYQLTATSATAKWVPPETSAEILRDLCPLRQIPLSLHRDADDPSQFYFRAVDEKDLWAIAPGQVLVITGNDAINVAGADRAVKVIRQYRETTQQGGRWRGYIDRMPRLLDRPALAPNVSVANFTVLGVADTVKSRADGSVWKLTPLLATDFQVEFSN